MKMYYRLCGRKKAFAALVFVFFFVSQTMWGQDSIIRSRDLNFKSEAEKKLFFNSLENSALYLNIFNTAIRSNELLNTSSALFQIDNCVAELKEHGRGRSEVKELKYIYTCVHKKFFKAYEYKNSFAHVFERGLYNCVSSTALYAIIFSKLGIPFQILEKPEHVFISAYPQTHKVFIETTSPNQGYIHFSDSYVEGYVNYLHAASVVSQEEYETQPKIVLFDKYYYSSTGISLRDLAAIQYANFALYQMEDNNYEAAIESVKRACFLSNNERNHHFLKYILSYEMANNNYSNSELVKYLAILCRFNSVNKKEISDQVIVDEFSRLTYHQLIQQSQYEKYDASYQEVVSSITDTSLKKEIDFHYHYELGRLGLSHSRQAAYVYRHLKAAYDINKEHADLQLLVLSLLSQRVEQSNEADKIRQLLNEYGNDFSFLKKNSWCNTTRVNCVLQLSYQCFALGMLQQAETYLTEFEVALAKDSSLKATENFVEKAYSEAAAVYYKKGNVKRSKQVLKTGLLYAPESFALRMRLSQL